MKITLLSSICFSVLAFASTGQTRQTGVAEHSLNSVNPNQINYQEQAQAPKETGRRPDVLINRAPCIDTLLFEDFQSETIPGTWLNQDLDGFADANSRPLDWYISFDQQTTLPGDTNYVATSSSWFTPAGTANNVLILSAVQPCASTVLKWSSAPFEGPTYMDGYEVRLSTTGTNIADFSTVLFTAAEGIDATPTPTAGTVHTSFNGNNGVLQNWEVSLGAYDNQTIYIAFFHNSTDDNIIMIDNIFMGLNIDYDVALNAVSSEPYYSTPIDLITPRTFTAELGLAAGTPVTTPTSSVDLLQGATSVFTDAPSAATLTAGNTVSLTTAAYTPLAVDDYTAVFTASAVETDPNLVNNVDSLFFVVSDSVFATEDGTFDGALGIGTTSSGFLGNMYTLPVTDILTSVTFTLSNPAIGDTVVAQIYDMNATGPNQIIGQTDTLYITATGPTEYTLPIVGGGLSLIPGDYLVGVRESISNNITLATNSAYYTPGLSWVFFNGTWNNNEDFNFLNTYLMRANFGPYCPAVSALYSESANALVVDFTDASTNSDSWVWDFGDGNTSTQQNPSHTYAIGGTYTVCLIASSVCDADTICTSVSVADCINPVADYTETVNAGGVVDFVSNSTSTGTVTYAWDFGDGQTSTVENPSNTYAANGTYTACLTVTDSCGIDSVCTTFTVNTIGIDENSLIDELLIYPVPAQETMTISNLTSGEDFTMELLNNLGQVVKVIHSEGLETVELNLSSIVDGYYHLRISNSVLIGTRPVLIKH